MRESKIQRNIIDYINTIGYCVKISVANKNGVPDILACIPNRTGVGKFYAFEVKESGGGDTSELQHIKIGMIRDAGGIAMVVSSLDEVKNIIEATI